ncbi:MAG: alpha-L-rhamnosidase [Bacteroidota bacterium]|nr:alpha-L-rhamnosidase [Bacteroidota bacterium]MDP4205046.1 alpha-L-rhamnosidase [Bacteroidota bacterium]
MKRTSLILALVMMLANAVIAQLPPVFDVNSKAQVRQDPRVRKYITPQRVVWKSDNTGEFVMNAESVLKPGIGQADLNQGNYLTLKSTGDNHPGIVLDFGKEIQGGVQIITTINNPKKAHVRIRFGESVSEAMCNVDEKGATNDHAMRDFVVELPWLGKLEIGNSGFRFVRIDLVDPDIKVELKEVNAIFSYRDIPYLGSFKSNDERLNKIWLTGAYTVHLNMQEYLWDGIKRDRLVWVGDLNPEVMTVNTVFGNNEVVPKSLDLARDLTPLPNWMNGLGSYSMWWILNQRDWYKYQGNFKYLQQQKSYLIGLLNLLMTKIDANGKEDMKDGRFLDWPSSENPEAIHAGLQSMMVMTFKAGAELCKALNEPAMVSKCNDAIAKLKKHIPDPNHSKQAAALLAISDLTPAEKMNADILSKDGVHGMSTYFGYFMLQARAKAGDYKGALDNIRDYWGAMLDLGATTFWEDFDIDWLKNASRIDEVVPDGKVDVHSSYGNYCYKGFRHSFCHGWASGPTSWLTQYVLGINVIEPGGKVIKLEPHLGDLKWVEGTFPTSLGVLSVKHVKAANGKVTTTFKAPKGVRVIL